MLDGIRCLVSVGYADCGDKRTTNSVVIMSKGSHRRPTKEDIYQDNWDKIYTPDKDKEKESTDEETRNESRDGE
tara:strand:- start:99 stop:320 length:222 start_codon:yes stop_codon:yes gene_type:complete